MFFKFQEEMRRIFLTDLEKHNILAWIIYKTNYQAQYEDLQKYQCRITTRNISNDINLPLAKVQRILKQLEQEGYFYYVKKSKSKHESSIIFANFIAKNDTVNKTVESIANTQSELVQDTVNETSSKNNSNIYSRIIERLNQTASRRFNPLAKKNIRLIQARLNEGYTEEDFYKVIFVKCDAWIEDSKMNIYLRPETLFGDKFDVYLKEQTKKQKKRMGTKL